MPQKKYILTEKAADDLHEAKAWSLSRWGKVLTDAYFDDLHKGAQFIAENHHAIQSRDELTGDTGLSLYPVREHYLVYLPIREKFIIVVSVIRQGRDIPTILKRWSYQIQREINDIRDKIAQGVIKIPNEFFNENK